MATTQTDAADLVARAIVAGVDIDAAIAATGQRVPTADRAPFRKDIATPERVARWLAEARIDTVALFNRGQRDALEAAIVAAERRATTTTEAPKPGWSIAGAERGHGHGVCDNCGGRGRAFSRVDSSGILGRVCGRCNVQDSESLSFA